MSQVVPVKAISSSNGLEATKRAYELMKTGIDTLDAAIAGIQIVEDDPEEITVGYGGLPNEAGEVELDGAVMHGPSRSAGAVASLTKTRYPAAVAKLVMEQTDHLLLAGEGAVQFARAHGFTEDNLLTEKSRKIWLYWKQTRSTDDDWLPPAFDTLDADVREFFEKTGHIAKGELKSKPSDVSPDKRKIERPTGTIHCACINSAGDISATTTTSGLAFKIPGRVADSAIVGAGLYVDNDIGSCGSTGRGEVNLLNCSSVVGVELMRNGMTPEEAGIEILKRIADRTEDRYRDAAGRPDFQINFYLLDKQGNHAGVSMWGPKQFAITDKQGSRLEDAVCLYQR